MDPFVKLLSVTSACWVWILLGSQRIAPDFLRYLTADADSHNSLGSEESPVLAPCEMNLLLRTTLFMIMGWGAFIGEQQVIRTLPPFIPSCERLKRRDLLTVQLVADIGDLGRGSDPVLLEPFHGEVPVIAATADGFQILTLDGTEDGTRPLYSADCQSNCRRSNFRRSFRQSNWWWVRQPCLHLDAFRRVRDVGVAKWFDSGELAFDAAVLDGV